MQHHCKWNFSKCANKICKTKWVKHVQHTFGFAIARHAFFAISVFLVAPETVCFTKLNNSHAELSSKYVTKQSPLI